jgi:DNA-binding transcriptional regulator YiaG
MKTQIVPFDVLIPTEDGKSVKESVVIDVVQEWDEEIGEWLLAPESLKEIEDMKARRMGLLLPEELKALRERFGVTQGQMADFLKIGEKSWSRWESGKHRQSHSINLLLRALDEGRLDTSALCGDAALEPERDWSSLFWECYRMGKPLVHAPGCAYDRYAPNYGANQEAADSQLGVAA